ncbi:hypothetical protein ACFO5X_07645 [Seohaeicola nanhaiensis]|uniref:Uncharacterized protein n=1 Tax=Seohaeicola nanhaiensis TaxID=1387282 RepID=A0ABV9KFK5_9RHOB
MTTVPTPERRGVLFEMLRRENIAQVSQRRRGTMGQEAREAVEAAVFLAAAQKSWGEPVFEPAPPVVSAPETRRNHKFFRTVGA